MHSGLKHAASTARSKGLLHLLRAGVPYIYDEYIGPHLPRRPGTFNGVRVRGARLGDGVLPWRDGDKPEFESGLVAAIEEHVEEGDDAVIVGGGWGVTTVRTARRVGKTGSVTVFEGSAREAARVRETLRVNGGFDNVTVHHAIVGPAVAIRGESGDAEQVNPEELPECNVLELDCEGAETTILKEMIVRPRRIFVESHSVNDAPPSEVREILVAKGYQIVSMEIADREIPDYCREKGLYVLTAIDEKVAN